MFSKIIRFVKDWTLPVAIVLGMALYVLFSSVPRLRGVGDSLAPGVQSLLPILMFFVLYITFCKVDYRKLLPVWWHLWIILVQMASVGLIVGVVMGLNLQGINKIIVESILISVICPCASAAAVVTQKLGGSIEEMTSYTFLSNFVSAFLIPLTIPLVEQGVHFGFAESFLSILYKVSFVLVLPMFLAYLTKHIALFKPILNWLLRQKDLSFYLWCVVLMVVSGTTLRNILHAQASTGILLMIGTLALLLCLAQFWCGRRIGSAYNRKVEAGQALGQKNTAFAIWVATTYLNPLSTVGPGCYILWQNIANSWQIWRYNHRQQ